MIVLLMKKETKLSTGETHYVPGDDYTKQYLKREIGVDSLTVDEFYLLQQLSQISGFDKFRFEIVEDC